MNFLMFNLVLEKAEEQEIKLSTSAGSWKCKRVPEKETRIYNGLKTISLTSGAGKTGQPLVKQ